MSKDKHPVDPPGKSGGRDHDNLDDYRRGYEDGKQAGGKDPWTDKGSKKYREVAP